VSKGVGLETADTEENQRKMQPISCEA